MYMSGLVTTNTKLLKKIFTALLPIIILELAGSEDSGRLLGVDQGDEGEAGGDGGEAG